MSLVVSVEITLNHSLLFGYYIRCNHIICGQVCFVLKYIPQPLILPNYYLIRICIRFTVGKKGEFNALKRVLIIVRLFKFMLIHVKN